jgi:MFS superfamily sulfate permease-like transporter
MRVIAVPDRSCASCITRRPAAGERLPAGAHGEGLSGTFVVNGSPTKTQILDEQGGRTQVANLTMSVIVLLVALFFTTVLTDMPKAVLGAIVFLIGLDLIDIAGLRRIARRRRSEFFIAAVTAVVVCAVGVEQGVILAIVVSLLEVIRRQYKPKDFVLGVTDSGQQSYRQAAPGAQSAPGLIIFRYDAELFYANANRFIDDIESLVDNAPDQVRWLILDAGGLDDIDYSAGIALAGLLDYLGSRQITFAMAQVDSSLVDTLRAYELLTGLGPTISMTPLPRRSRHSAGTHPLDDRFRCPSGAWTSCELLGALGADPAHRRARQ